MSYYLYVFTVIWLLLLAHEMGHLLAAYYFDRPILKMIIGSGPIFYKNAYKGVAYECRILPLKGVVKILSKSRHKHINLIITAAGPFVNLVLGIILLNINLQDEALASFILCIGNLIPFEESDGSQLLKEWKRK